MSLGGAYPYMQGTTLALLRNWPEVLCFLRSGLMWPRLSVHAFLSDALAFYIEIDSI